MSNPLYITPNIVQSVTSKIFEKYLKRYRSQARISPMTLKTKIFQCMSSRIFVALFITNEKCLYNWKADTLHTGSRSNVELMF